MSEQNTGSLTPDEQAMLKQIDDGLDVVDVSLGLSPTAAEPPTTQEATPVPAETPLAQASDDLPDIPDVEETLPEQPTPDPSTPQDTEPANDIEKRLKELADGKAQFGRLLAEERRKVAELRVQFGTLMELAKQAEQRQRSQRYQFDETGQHIVPVQPETPPFDGNTAEQIARLLNQPMPQQPMPQTQAVDPLSVGYEAAKNKLIGEEPTRAATFANIEQAYTGMLNDLQAQSMLTGVPIYSPDQAIAIADTSGLGAAWDALYPNVPWRGLFDLYKQRNNEHVLRAYVDQARGGNGALAPASNGRTQEAVHKAAVQALTEAPRPIADRGRNDRPETALEKAESLLAKLSSNPDLAAEVLHSHPGVIDKIERQLTAKTS